MAVNNRVLRTGEAERDVDEIRPVGLQPEAALDGVRSEVMKAEEAFPQATSLASKRHALDRLAEALAQYCHLTVTGRTATRLGESGSSTHCI